MTNVEEAYKAYFNEIYKFCFYRLGNKENAEDITSEVFMKLTEQDLSKIENPRAWLYKVARNLIYDKYVKTPNISDSLHHDEEGEVDFEDKNTHLENYVFEKDFLERIQSELYKIDSVTADIIVMKVWDELPFSEIANITNLQEETVRKRFQRGISKLKNNLLKSKNMEPNQVPSQAAPTQGITSAETIDKKSFLPKSLKYAITFFAIFAVLGVGAYGAYTYNKTKNEDKSIANDQDDTKDTQENSEENNIEDESDASDDSTNENSNISLEASVSTDNYILDNTLGNFTWKETATTGPSGMLKRVFNLQNASNDEFTKATEDIKNFLENDDWNQDSYEVPVPNAFQYRYSKNGMEFILVHDSMISNTALSFSFTYRAQEAVDVETEAKVYTNDALDIKLTIPSNWTVEETSTNGITMAIFKDQFGRTIYTFQSAFTDIGSTPHDKTINLSINTTAGSIKVKDYIYNNGETEPDQIAVGAAMITSNLYLQYNENFNRNNFGMASLMTLEYTGSDTINESCYVYEVCQ